MKIKKTVIITLLLLCILMIGAVSASSDSNDTVASSDVNDDTISTTGDYTNGEKTSTINTKKENEKAKNEDDTISTTKNYTNGEKTSTINTKKENEKANNNDELLTGGAHNPRSFSGLAHEISLINDGEEKRLDFPEYCFDNHTDTEYKYGITIDKSITLIGNHITIDAQNQARIFNIASGAKVTLINITFINGYVNYEDAKDYYGGGAILNEGDLTLENTTFHNNTAITIIKDPDILYGYGGAIYTRGNSKLTIINSNFTNNTAKGNYGYGGAIHSQDSSQLSITNSTFTNNTAEENGGSIYANTNTMVNIENSTFNNNTAYFGGAICTESDLNINNTQFTENKAINGKLNSGGAIYIYPDSTVTITNSQFIKNSAKDGGAINNYGKLNIINNTIINNIAERNGGSIIADAYAITNITYSTFNNNTADFGGVIYNGLSNLNIKNSTFSNNTANNYGGAIYSWNNTNLDIEYSNFTTNKDNTYNHSAISIASATNTTQNIRYCIFFDNDVHVLSGSIDLSLGNYVYIKNITEFIIAPINNSTTNDTIHLNITEKNGFDGILTIKIGDNEYNITFTHGNCIDDTIKIEQPGTYKVLIDFPGNPTYRDYKTESNEFTIKYATKFTIETISDSTTDKPITIIVKEENGFTGLLKIKIGDKEYNITFTNGTGTTNAIALPQGTYQATINFSGNNDYKEADATSNIFTIKYPTKFTIETISDSTTDKPIKITAREENRFTGLLKIKIGDKEYDITFTNGTGTTNAIALPQGTYQATINFSGNNDYKEADATSNIFTIKYPTKFTIETISDSTTDKPIKITAREENRFTGFLKIRIGDKEYDITFINGKGTTNAILLPQGIYQAAINFSGNTQYTKADTTSNIFTIKYPTAKYEDLTIDISNTIITPVNNLDEVTYICYIKDDKEKSYLDGTVTVTCNSMTYTFKFDESEKISGFWILSNDKIVLRKTISSSNDKKGLNIVSSSSNSKLYNNLFKGEDGGNTVLYMISNTRFSTNQLSLTSINGITNIKLTYSKNGETKVISRTESVKFRHDIIQSISSSKIRISLKKVKIRKSAKKLILKATLKKGKKALKKKKVTFKFNGKKYVRKTNKKGVAKLIIKRKVLRKLKVGKKVIYQASYGKKTTKRTAKVKK